MTTKHHYELLRIGLAKQYNLKNSLHYITDFCATTKPTDITAFRSHSTCALTTIDHPQSFHSVTYTQNGCRKQVPLTLSKEFTCYNQRTISFLLVYYSTMFEYMEVQDQLGLLRIEMWDRGQEGNI